MCWDTTFLPDADFYQARDQLYWDGLTRTAQVQTLHASWRPSDEPPLWAIVLEGPSPLRLPGADQPRLHVSIGYEDELDEAARRELQELWSEPRVITVWFHRFGHGRTGELSLQYCPVAQCDAIWRAHRQSRYRNRPLHISF